MSDDRSVDRQAADDRQLLDLHGRRLIDLARASVLHGFEFGRPFPVDRGNEPAALAATRATHVVLRARSGVAGIEPTRRAGGVRAWRPLLLDVAGNAFAATFADRRHAALKPAERFDLAVTVMLLGEPLPIALDDPAGDGAAGLAPGDGALLEWDGGSQALFPEAWTFALTAKSFLAEALRRAHAQGLEPGALPRAYRFSVTSVSDGE
jgi:AMMECR1 domain-containing protein